MDAYSYFRFRLRWSDGGYVLGASKASGMARETQVISDRAGRDPASPGRETAGSAADHEPISLERGVSYDAGFAAWAGAAVERVGPAPEAERRDLTLEIFNEAGQKVLAFAVRRAWPSALAAMPDLDADQNALVVQSLVLQHEGWSRVEG